MNICTNQAVNPDYTSEFLLHIARVGKMIEELSNFCRTKLEKIEFIAGLPRVRRFGYPGPPSKVTNYTPSSCPPYVQRDVKSTNILLRTDSHALLSDFGLAITLGNLLDSIKRL